MGQPKPLLTSFFPTLFCVDTVLFLCFPILLSYKPRQENQSITDSTAPPGQVKLSHHETKGCRDNTAETQNGGKNERGTAGLLLLRESP